jgi:hypothetical protein
MKATDYEEEDMGRARMVVSALLAIAFLTVSLPPAHAGGGPGAGSPLPVVLACRVILNGGNPTQVLTVTDSISQVLQVGHAAVLCDLTTQPSATVKSGPALTDLSAVETNSLTCYPVSAVAGSDRVQDSAIITDPFGEDAVKLASFGLICVPALQQ